MESVHQTFWFIPVEHLNDELNDEKSPKSVADQYIYAGQSSQFVLIVACIVIYLNKLLP